jgi:hypothetical protein
MMLLLRGATGASQDELCGYCSKYGRSAVVKVKKNYTAAMFIFIFYKNKLIKSASFSKIYCHCTQVMTVVAIATALIKSRRTVCCFANGSNVTL